MVAQRLSRCVLLRICCPGIPMAWCSCGIIHFAVIFVISWDISLSRSWNRIYRVTMVWRWVFSYRLTASYWAALIQTKASIPPVDSAALVYIIIPPESAGFRRKSEPILCSLHFLKLRYRGDSPASVFQSLKACGGASQQNRREVLGLLLMHWMLSGSWWYVGPFWSLFWMVAIYIW